MESLRAESEFIKTEVDAFCSDIKEKEAKLALPLKDPSEMTGTFHKVVVHDGKNKKEDDKKKKGKSLWDSSASNSNDNKLKWNWDKETKPKPKWK